MPAITRRALITGALATALTGALSSTAAAAVRRPGTVAQRDPFVVPACTPPGSGLPDPCPPIQPHRTTRMGLDNVYSSTPSVVMLPDGSLRMAWFNGPDHYGYGASRTMTAVSIDQGATWRPPVEIPGMRNARDLCLAVDADGVVWATYFSGTAANPALGVYARPSTDYGATFGAAVRIDRNLPYAACTAPIREVDGVLWMPFYGRATGESIDSVYMARSTNRGVTWDSERIADGPAAGIHLNEPWLVPSPGGLFQVFHRYGGFSEIGVTESTTGGISWTTPRPIFAGTGRPAAVPADGMLLVVYRSIQSRRAEYAISTDGGATWPHQGVPMLYNAKKAQFGMVYGSPVAVAPNRIYCPVAMEESTSRCALWHTTFS